MDQLCGTSMRRMHSVYWRPCRLLPLIRRRDAPGVRGWSTLMRSSTPMEGPTTRGVPSVPAAQGNLTSTPYLMALIRWGQGSSISMKTI